MSTAVLRNFNEIEQHIHRFREGIPALRTVKPPPKSEKKSKYLRVAQTIEELAENVKTNWNGFNPDQKESLRNFAYLLLRESEKQQEEPLIEVLPKLLSTAAKVSIKLLKLKIEGEYEEFMLCVDKLDELVDNILDAIEREDPLYQTVLIDTLEELKFNPENQTGAEDACDGLREL